MGHPGLSRWIVLFTAGALAGCGAPQPASAPTASISPTATSTSIPPTRLPPTPTPLPPPSVTRITVDGDGTDWDGYQQAGGLATADTPAGLLDLTAGYVFVNRHALYIRATVADPAAEFSQMDFTIGADARRFVLTWKPQEGSSAFIGEVTSGYQALGRTRHSTFVLGPELEARIDLRDLRSPKTADLAGLDAYSGTCCEGPNWQRADQWIPTDTPVVGELDPVWYIDPADTEAIALQFPGGIPGMQAFLPHTSTPLEPRERMSRIVETTQAHQLPQGYWVERIFAPEIPGIFSVGLDGAGNMLVSTSGRNPTLYLVDRQTGDATRLFGLSAGIHWSGLIGNPAAVGAWAGVGEDIYYIYPDGRTETWLANAQGVPMSLGPDGALYGVGFDGKLSRFTQFGRQVLNDRVFRRRGEMSVAVSHDGIVYVTDSEIGAIWRLTEAGELVPFVRSGLASGDPVPLEIAPDGTLYGAGRPYPIFTIDPQTGALSPLEDIGWVQHFINFSIDPLSGLLYFADPTFSHLVEVDPVDSEIRFIIRGGGNTQGLALGEDGTLYFADSTRLPVEPGVIYALDSAGDLKELATIDSPVMNMDMGPDARLYVLTFVPGVSTVLTIDPSSGETESLKQWEPNERTIFTLSVDPNSGQVFVYDYNSNQILRLSATGEAAASPIRFPAQEGMVALDFSPDGVLNLLAIREEQSPTGTLTFRTFFRSPDGVSLERLADFHHQGCCVGGAIAAAGDGSIYVIAVPPEGLDFSLWHLLPTGELIQLSNRLGIDPLSIVMAATGDLFYTSVEGIFRIWYAGSP